MRGIYFSVNNDSEGFQLPMNPEVVNVVNSASGEVYNIAKLGNVSVPKSVELKEFSIETFLPAQNYHFLAGPFMPPDYFIQKLEKWMEEELPVRYIYVNGSFAINELVTIESFPYDESYGSDDVNFSLSLKKYVPFGPKKMQVVKQMAPANAVASTKPMASRPVTVVKKAAPPRQNSKVQPQTYTLIKGDSLWKVAQKHLGDGNRYQEIAKLNGIKASDYKKLPVGLKVKLPPK